MREATNKGSYSYYHLLSGHDLPLKTQNEIHLFFEANKGMEFIHFGEAAWVGRVKKRLKYYWLFQNYAGHSKRIDKMMLRYFDKIGVVLQKRLMIDRIRGLEFSAGSEWFSITDDFARFIVSQDGFIKHHFSHGLCADECFVQTIAVNSIFKERIYAYNNGNCRYIKWGGSNPCVLKDDDFNAIMSSGCLFARKFDEAIDARIIDRIFETIILNTHGVRYGV